MIRFAAHFACYGKYVIRYAGTASRAYSGITMSLLKKLIAIRISSKRSAPSTTPAGSGSTPADQWVWSALDIARLAAMADDLAHVPSIKGSADIFTQMLERLQVSLVGCSACVTVLILERKRKVIEPSFTRSPTRLVALSSQLFGMGGSARRHPRDTKKHAMTS